MQTRVMDNASATGADSALGHYHKVDGPEPANVAHFGGATAAGSVVIVNDNVLMRDCLSKALAAARGADDVSAFASIDAWLEEAGSEAKASLVLFCIGQRRVTDEEVSRQLLLLKPRGIVVVIMADLERPDQILEALDSGARGYIPTSTPLDVAIEAMHLVRAGGVFVPAASLMSSMRTGEAAPGGGGDTLGSIFTARQTAVVKALREGKANKRIAYELNMCESTVKVHVRNIMRKLNARNRTEVAYRTNSLFAGDSR